MTKSIDIQVPITGRVRAARFAKGKVELSGGSGISVGRGQPADPEKVAPPSLSVLFDWAGVAQTESANTEVLDFNLTGVPSCTLRVTGQDDFIDALEAYLVGKSLAQLRVAAAMAPPTLDPGVTQPNG